MGCWRREVSWVGPCCLCFQIQSVLVADSPSGQRRLSAGKHNVYDTHVFYRLPPSKNRQRSLQQENYRWKYSAESEGKTPGSSLPMNPSPANFSYVRRVSRPDDVITWVCHTGSSLWLLLKVHLQLRYYHGLNVESNQPTGGRHGGRVVCTPASQVRGLIPRPDSGCSSFPYY